MHTHSCAHDTHTVMDKTHARLEQSGPPKVNNQGKQDKPYYKISYYSIAIVHYPPCSNLRDNNHLNEQLELSTVR